MQIFKKPLPILKLPPLRLVEDRVTQLYFHALHRKTSNIDKYWISREAIVI